MRTKRFLSLALAAAAPVWGQVPPANPLDSLHIGAKIGQPGFDPAQFADVSGLYRHEFVQYLLSKPAHRAFKESAVFEATFRGLLQAVENGRVDEQLGASPSAAAAVNAAEKAGVTGLITSALESGALAQTLDQNVLTVRGNAEGLFRFVTGQEVIPVCQTPQDTNCDPSPLNNLEFTSSFDVSRSNSQNVTGQSVLTGAEVAALLTSNKRQFASASARYVIVGSRDLRSPTYRAAWEKWYADNRTALGLTSLQLLQAQDAIFNLIDTEIPAGTPSVYGNWHSQARQAMTKAFAASATEAALTAAVVQQYDLLDAAMRKAMPDLDTRLESLSTAYSRYFSATRAGLVLANKPLLTAEVTYSQPTLQPKLVTAKVIFAWSPKAAGTVNPGTLTFNGAFDLYTKAQPSNATGGTARWRDAQFAVQFDRPLGGSGNPASLAIGAYVQYQMSPSRIVIPAGSNLLQNIPLPANATQILAQKGTIVVAHASLTLQIPSTGIRLPIGFSYSNRTELVTGSEIRGHIGFSFDTHSILLTAQR